MPNNIIPIVYLSHTAKGLQTSLDKLAHYAANKQLTINTKKSKTMIFNITGKYIKEEPVNAFCYLGFELKSSGTVKHAMKTLHGKAKQSIKASLMCYCQIQYPS